MKPKLLAVELWGLGDLVIASPFLQAACTRFAVTLLAKPFALDLRERFWPAVHVLPFTAPWTSFRGKYRLHAWPWRALGQLRTELRAVGFQVGVAGRWDPRDHVLLKLSGAQERVGFPRLGSGFLLTRRLALPDERAHRSEFWRAVGQALELPVPPLSELTFPAPRAKTILVHTGAGQPVRVWPLGRYRQLVQRLRAAGRTVQVACDLDQHEWWLAQGEKECVAPARVRELLALIDQAGLFIGNDSGPGHLAAFSGLPTFTLFGPQLPEWFRPLHPQARWLDGRPCPYKPCRDYCRFAKPFCLHDVTEEEVWERVWPFVRAHLG
jgi:heptosyltransferase-2